MNDQGQTQTFRWDPNSVGGEKLWFWSLRGQTCWHRLLGSRQHRSPSSLVRTLLCRIHWHLGKHASHPALDTGPILAQYFCWDLPRTIQLHCNPLCLNGGEVEKAPAWKYPLAAFPTVSRSRAERLTLSGGKSRNEGQWQSWWPGPPGPTPGPWCSRCPGL